MPDIFRQLLANTAVVPSPRAGDAALLPEQRIATIAGMQNVANGVGAAVGVVMGSSSDWDIMKHAVEMLDRLG